MIGKARLVEDVTPYGLTVTVSPTTERVAQERLPHADPGVRAVGPGWFAGDFHVHSRESGDARASLDEIAEAARLAGLDFVVITDHNTTSTLDHLVAAQQRNPDILFIPGMEVTTYAGHLNAIGTRSGIDHRVGSGSSIEAILERIHADGGLASINHPAHDLGTVCIGCGWEHPVDPAAIDAVEIETGAVDPVGALFLDRTLDFWMSLAVDGRIPAAIGGSDDHRAGIDLDFLQSPVGSPTTLVYAEHLSVAGILAGVRSDRTVVKLQDAGDPMAELRSTPTGVTVRVMGSAGTVRFVVDGEPGPQEPVLSDPFTHTLALEPAGQLVRAEVFVDGEVRTITSHVRVNPPDSGSGCTTSAGPTEGWLTWLRRR